MTDEEKKCVYCREVRAPSKEHVLQKSLGGDLTTTSQHTASPVVCKQCNQGFSGIDQSLAERSLPAFTRAAFTPEQLAVQLGGEHFHYDCDLDMWLEVKILNGMRAHLQPQLHYRDGGLSFLASDAAEKEAFTNLLSSRRSAGRLSSMYIKTTPRDKCTTPRIVQHRSDDLFVRAADEAEGRQLLGLIDAEWLKLEEQLRVGAYAASIIERPRVNVTIPIRFDDNYRAVAKTAFNFLATQKGAAFALRTEFDGIRDYIRGISIVHEGGAEPGRVAIDTRYVRAAAFGAPPIVPTDAHAVALFYDKPTLWGLVTLYKQWSFVVMLGEIDLDESILEAHEFTIDRSGNAALHFSELFARLWKRDHGEAS